jgi:predicted translin family RNA/ssDNA-binding protein
LEEENLDKLVKDTVLSENYYNNLVSDMAREMKIEVGSGRPHPRAPRLLESLSTRIEDFARYKSFRHYLANGSLISPDAFLVSDGDVERSIVTDEEYLAGACIGLSHDLANYALARATNAGVDPKVVTDVQNARDIVAKILEELLQFDFRNSPMRRKYDSTKYYLKSLETILYELSVAKVLGGSELKKVKLDENGGDTEMKDLDDTIPKDKIAALRERVHHRDQLRERLIKTCRDGQKAGKQAIFALHRGDTVKALTLLSDCEKCVTNDLMPILREEPSLRGGAFSGVLEEYVEAYLFYAWLKNDDEDKKNEPSGKILDLAALPLVVSPEEYLGGLCDLTGEIGRFAVAQGTKRDKKSVELCLDTNKRIYNSLFTIGQLPASIFKKKNGLKISVEKLERMMYELSLMELAGRNQYSSALESSEQRDNED